MKEENIPIREMYNTLSKKRSGSMDFSYTPTKSYIDPLLIKKQKDKQAMKYMKDLPKGKINNKIKKGTFLEMIEARESKLPSPDTYDPHQYCASYKDRKISNLPDRVTIFQEISKNQIKYKPPGPSNYSSELKSKSKSSCAFNKAQNVRIFQGDMSKGVNLPGIGNYNIKRYVNGTVLGKWDHAKRPMDVETKNRTPSMINYNPHQIDKGLFSQISKIQKSQRNFPKAKRFSEKQNNGKEIIHTQLNEWCPKQNKKELMSRFSNHSKYSKSVYR